MQGEQPAGLVGPECIEDGGWGVNPHTAVVRFGTGRGGKPHLQVVACQLLEDGKNEGLLPVGRMGLALPELFPKEAPISQARDHRVTAAASVVPAVRDAWRFASVARVRKSRDSVGWLARQSGTRAPQVFATGLHPQAAVESQLEGRKSTFTPAVWCWVVCGWTAEAPPTYCSPTTCAMDFLCPLYPCRGSGR